MPGRHFTVEQANSLLPRLRPLVAEMLAARQRILDARPEIWPVLESAIGNGGSKKAGEMVTEFERLQRCVLEISALGVELKDINTGLCDFPSRRHGREVYLCWRYDEPSVAHWHDLEAGFAGRQPL